MPFQGPYSTEHKKNVPSGRVFRVQCSHWGGNTGQVFSFYSNATWRGFPLQVALCMFFTRRGGVCPRRIS